MDISKKILETTGKNLRNEIHKGKVELKEFDASYSLPFLSNSFDAVFSLDLLECLHESKKLKLLREIYRVLKPGGRMVIEHTDWDTQVWNTDDKDLERRLVHAYCDIKQKWMKHAEGWMGRKLWGWVHQQKLFQKARVEPYVLTNTEYKPPLFGHGLSLALEVVLGDKKYGISKKDLSRFLTGLKIQAKRSSYFYSVNRYVLIVYKRR